MAEFYKRVRRGRAEIVRKRKRNLAIGSGLLAAATLAGATILVYKKTPRLNLADDIKRTEDEIQRTIKETKRIEQEIADMPKRRQEFYEKLERESKERRQKIDDYLKGEYKDTLPDSWSDSSRKMRNITDESEQFSKSKNNNIYAFNESNTYKRTRKARGVF